MLKDYEPYREWALLHPHTVQMSPPRSGRYWLAYMVADVTGVKHVDIEDYAETGPNGEPARYISAHLFRSPMWENVSRYVLLVRDPRDTILSHAYWRNKRIDKPDVGDAFMDSRFWESQAREWRLYFDIFLAFDTVVVQYERLCLYPRLTIERVIRHAGLQETRPIMEVVDLRDGIQEQGAPSGLEKEPVSYSSNQERYLAHCLKWQRDDNFTPAHHEVIWDVCGDIMQPYGYAINGHSANLLRR